MSPEERASLERAIRDLHGCEATLEAEEDVLETFQGRTVWEGSVGIFALQSHPMASRCYAWSHALEGTEERAYYAVLEEPPVQSARDAVRAVVLREIEGG